MGTTTTITTTTTQQPNKQQQQQQQLRRKDDDYETPRRPSSCTIAKKPKRLAIEFFNIVGVTAVSGDVRVNILELCGVCGPAWACPAPGVRASPPARPSHCHRFLFISSARGKKIHTRVR